MGVAEHGVVDAVAFQAVARGLPALRADAGPLGAGAGPLVFLFPGRRSIVLAAVVRDEWSGALVAAVGDGPRLADGGPGAGFLAVAGVVPVARHGLAGQAGVGVGDDLTGRAIAVVLRLLGDRVVAGGGQRLVGDEHDVLAETLTRPLGGHPPQLVDDPGSGRRGDLEERSRPVHRHLRPPVGRDQQTLILPRQAPRPPAVHVSRVPAPDVTNVPKQHGLSPVSGPIQDGTNAVITPTTRRPSRTVTSHYGVTLANSGDTVPGVSICR